MNRYSPTAAVEHLPTFDGDEFRTMCAVSRFLPPKEKAEALHRLAISNTEEAAGLRTKAVAYVDRGDKDSVTLALEMLDGVEIRLAAAAHCRRLSAGWAAEAARSQPAG